jgi:type II secretory pathway pseudopilin PulG
MEFLFGVIVGALLAVGLPKLYARYQQRKRDKARRIP